MNCDSSSTKTKPIEIKNINTHDGKKDGQTVIQIKLGYGWKGLGSSQLLFNEKTSEYTYTVIEPELTSIEEGIKNKLIYLFGINANICVSNATESEKIQYLQHSLQQIISDYHIKLAEESWDNIFYYIMRDFIGYGKIDILMNDEVIEDISCDGTHVPVFIYHREYESIKTNIFFDDIEVLDSFVIKLAQICGKQLSIYEPIIDGKLDDGSRLSVTLGKTVTRESNFTIRRFREKPLTPIDFIDSNTLTLDMAAYFWLAIEHGSSVLFCGGTASGKTTALNALALFIPASYKIVSIEDTREVNLPHENWIAGTTRLGFTQSQEARTGKDIDMFDLTRAALRQRPKVIIVGEVRGREAYNLFQAMTTGHLSYSTVHAGDLRTLIQRLESPPINLPRSLLTALDIVVFLNAVSVNRKPVRRITNVTEILRLDAETNRLVTFTPFYWVSELEDRFEIENGSRVLGRIQTQNGWSDEQLQQELRNRKRILRWMQKNNLRSYREVAQIISDYSKNPQVIIQKAIESEA